MIDVIRTLDIDYVSTNPGSSFRSLHESLVNYGGNKKPKLLTCLHEESAVAMAHVYAKAAGKPMGVFLHGTVGLQHAAMVRDYIKWDDAPASLQHFAESTVRAYKIATTPPMEPVLVMADIELQEEAVHGAAPTIQKLARSIPAQGDAAALAEAAKWLVGAKFPVIVADRMARNQAGVDALVSLSETLGAAVVDKAKGLLNVTFQPDGDLMYAPGVLWTAAHHQIPLLMVMHNNRGYYQEVMHLQRMAALHRRRPDTALVGNEIDNPAIDYAKLAQAHGVWAEGPISDPALLKPALQRALAVVKSGRPALLDVICQPR